MKPKTSEIAQKLSAEISRMTAGIAAAGIASSVNLPDIGELFEEMAMNIDMPARMTFSTKNGLPHASYCATDSVREFRLVEGRWAFTYKEKTCFVGPGSNLEKELIQQYETHLANLVVND